VDGRPISTAQVEYPAVIVPANILANQANKLAYIVYLTANDPQGKKTIPTTFAQDLTLTTQDNPGLQVKLPAGLKITRPDGTPVTQITMTSLPPDRTPMPFPNGVSPVRLLSIQPADAILSQPVQVTYPNLSKNARPGTKVPLYRADHDTESGQYIRYGTGTVSADGRQIVPDMDPATGKPYGLPAFSWHFPAPPQPQNQGPGDGPNPRQCPCEGATAGSAVDLVSGTERYISTDIGVSGGRVPFVINRVYRSEDNRQGPFGIGSAHNFELILQEITPQYVELVQANNNRTRFSSLNNSTTQFINEDDSSYRGSILTKSSSGYTLRGKSGDSMIFGVSSSLGGKLNYFLTKTTDRNGNGITINRDAGSNITEISSVSGKLTFAVDLNTGRIQKITDQGGRSVSYQYDAAGRLITVADPLGQTISYTYDAANRLLTTTNSKGIVEANRIYDTNGRIVKEEMADGSFMQFAYTLINATDPKGGLVATEVIDLNGRSHVFQINGESYNSGVADSFGNRSFVDYTPGTNRINSMTDRLGRKITPIYDANENLIQLKAYDGSISTFTYEPNFKLPTSSTDPLGRTTTTTYDIKGNPIEFKDPLGKALKMSFNSFGQVVQITNALNQNIQYVYDDRGNLIKLTDPSGNITTHTYDILNRLTKSTNALGHEVKYQYDILDRTTQVTSAEGRITKYAYDPNGNLISITDPNGNTTRYDYDRRDRLTKRTDPSGKVETYQYDAIGNLLRTTDRKEQTTIYAYDTNDRLVSTTYADGSVTTNAYDAMDRLVSTSDTAAGPGNYTFSYDQFDRMVKEVSPQGTLEYTYDLVGRRTSVTLNGQVHSGYAYDNNDRLTNLSTSGGNFTLSYDALDRPVTITMPNGIQASYTYDEGGRTTRIKYSKNGAVLRDLTNSYDALGRRTSYSGNPVTEPRDTATDTATVNALNQYTNLNGRPISHDDNGNQTQLSAKWDVRNRLLSLTELNLTASFTYDAIGRRASKTVNGKKETYIYDGANIIQEVGANNATYIHGLGIDAPLVRKGNQNEYYLSDILGSIIALADDSGNVKTGYNYSPYGKKNVEGAASDNPFGYTAREDDGTGLYYYRARYYNPAQKRFIAEDPKGFQGGDSNFYTYALGDPINLTDPSGLAGMISWQTRTVQTSDRANSYIYRQVGPSTNSSQPTFSPRFNDGENPPDPTRSEITSDITEACIYYQFSAGDRSRTRSPLIPAVNAPRQIFQKGHVVGHLLGGTGIARFNFFPQNSSINQGAVNAFERSVNSYLTNHFMSSGGPTCHGPDSRECDLSYVVRLNYDQGMNYEAPTSIDFMARFRNDHTCGGRITNNSTRRSPTLDIPRENSLVPC
jgi:RHS repeat-associated protein